MFKYEVCLHNYDDVKNLGELEFSVPVNTLDLIAVDGYGGDELVVDAVIHCPGGISTIHLNVDDKNGEEYESNVQM